MKKVLVVILALVLISSTTINVIAAPGNSNKGNGKGPDKQEKVLVKEEKQQKSNIKKEFKAELNEMKKDVIKERNEINKEKELLEEKYQELLAAGDTAGAEALLEEIKVLNVERDALQSQMKQIINERHMVVKTLYSEEELEKFENAAALIKQMYEDANVLGATNISIKNNLIKFEAPPYMKGKNIMIPVRTIAEEFGAEVKWDSETQSVIISKEGVVVEFKVNSTTVFVDGNPVDMDDFAEITCGRTYVPLRFLAKVFNLEVIEDEENEIIDIVDETEEDAEDTEDTEEDLEEELDDEVEDSEEEPVDETDESIIED